MAAVAMEAPNSMMAHDLRSEQGKVLQAVQDIPIGEVPEAAVRAQYAAGEIDDKTYIDYTEEDGVAPDSNIETYAAIRLHIDNWRWHGVPFYLRTGKAMNRKLTQIVIYFKPTPHSMFRDPETGESSLVHNRLTINVQPDEGISLRFEGKVPGPGLDVQSAGMDFDFIHQFGGHVPEAYGHLLLDAMQGDRSLFKDRYEIEAAWRIVMPVLDYWAALPGEGMHTTRRTKRYDPPTPSPAAQPRRNQSVYL
jgi:glucose-6-phosphate 1-dehydrogenase